MSELVTDPNDPRLGHGVDKEPVPQNEAYLVLSEEERAKGFRFPLRRSYQHVGLKPKYPLRDLTPEEEAQHNTSPRVELHYVKFEEYPESDSPKTGRFWTHVQLNSKGCGYITSMSLSLCETFARDPSFYGATYCCGCRKHLPLEEFVWTEDGVEVGK